MNVDVRIEEFVLHGFPQGDQLGIGDAAGRELSRLFAERGVPQSLAHGADAPRLDAGSFEMSPEQSSETIGAQVARSVYGALSPRRERTSE